MKNTITTLMNAVNAIEQEDIKEDLTNIIRFYEENRVEVPSKNKRIRPGVNEL